MEPKLITKKDMKMWVHALSQNYPFIAPTRHGENFDFEIVQDID